jgi:glutaredoxin
MVTVYSIKDCPYCAELKEMLINENIEFKDVDVDLEENEQEFNKIMEAAQIDKVPIIKIGSQLFVPDKSFDTIQEAFELTKRFLG